MKFSFWIIIKGIFNVILVTLKSFLWLLIPFAAAIFAIVIVYFFYFIKFRYVEHYKPLNNRGLYKEPGVFKRLFYLFPKRLAYDYVHQDPNDFDQFGIHMIIGKQGSGKSTTVAYLLKKWQKIYPDLKVYTNMGYLDEDEPLEYWQQLIVRNNGKSGVVNVIDDFKAWWSNADSKNLPPEILGEICQQRKQKKAIIGTIQVFSELPKAFRSQTHQVYIPKTYFGCLTIVKKSDICFYDEKREKFIKTRGMFFFVHTKEIRDSFDTFKKIQKYKDVDWDISPYFTASGESSHACEVTLAVTEKTNKSLFKGKK